MARKVLLDEIDSLKERLELAKSRILEIKGEHINQYAPYFELVSEHIIRCIELYEDRDGLKEIEGYELEMLADRNMYYYKDIVNYDKSYLNVGFAFDKLGDFLGGKLSFLYNELMGMIPWAVDKRLDLITIYSELFLEIYGVYEDELCEEADIKRAAHRINECIYWFYHDYCEVFTFDTIARLFGDAVTVVDDIVSDADLSKVNYLYAYGVNITENDIQFARYINSLPQDEIDSIASCYVGGFVKGFESSRKDMSKKSLVKVEYPIGFERVVRKSKELFKEQGLVPIFARDGVFSFEGGAKSRNAYLSSMNKQWLYDHKDDKGYYFDKRFYNRRVEAIEEAFKAYADKAKIFAGPAVIQTFGERDFTPVNKKGAYKFTDKQNIWNVEYLSKVGEINNRYIPRDEYSFTIIAFPIPEIGDEEFFKKVFDKTMEINTLDYDKYQRMQQAIIDILDKADHVHILGQGNNKTDINVNLHTLKNPDAETLFENCVADVNIPVGEVFTSPVLKGTNGILNVSHVFLNGLQYNDLVIEVKDGMVADYSCSNFDDEAECKRMIFENVLFRHDTLPIGEFAIGTNTTAYRMARDYNIEDKLPILIAEKTGPHFAFGDTCYSHEEDVKTYNPDGKAIIARENECSALRNEDVSKAYFNCHTDVTMPFEELALIEAVLPDGSSIPIIKDGRFVVAGCEELNVPLD